MKGAEGNNEDILHALTYIKALEVSKDKVKVKKASKVDSLNKTCQRLGVDLDRGVLNLSSESF